jgi:hypothetical protein
MHEEMTRFFSSGYIYSAPLLGKEAEERLARLKAKAKGAKKSLILCCVARGPFKGGIKFVAHQKQRKTKHLVCTLGGC